MEHIRADKPVLKTMIRKFIDNQQALESEMARAIVRVFNTNYDLITPLRFIVLNAIEDIEYLQEHQVRGKSVVAEAFTGDAQFYGFVSGANKNGLNVFDKDNFVQQVKDKLLTLNAVECSDMIRFYGEVIERGSKRPKLIIPAKYFDIETGKDKRPPLPPKLGSEVEALNKKRLDYQKDSGNKGWWNKNIAEAGAKRRRIKSKDVTPEQLQEHKNSLTNAERVVVSLRAGISRWIQLPDDLGNKIDKVFGLQKGATISGTTTDTIFFLNRMTLIDEAMKTGSPLKKHYFADNGPKGLDPIYYMLPLATLVSEGHHTVVEVALPLSLNGIITQYKIGRYTTLMPDRKGRNNDGANEILKILRSYQNKSKQMLIYYDHNGEIGGCINFMSEDMPIWDKIAVADEKLMNKIDGFPPKPTKQNIASLHPEINKLLNT